MEEKQKSVAVVADSEPASTTTNIISVDIVKTPYDNV